MFFDKCLHAFALAAVVVVVVLVAVVAVVVVIVVWVNDEALELGKHIVLYIAALARVC